MIRAAIAVSFLIACGRGEATPGPSPTPTPTHSSAEDSAMPRTTLSWRSHTVAGHGLALDVPTDADVTEADAAGFHNVSLIRPTLELSVWIGKDMSLAWWRGRFGGRDATLGAEASATICGRPGARQEVTVAAEHASGLVPGQDGAIGHVEHDLPARIHVAVSGTTKAGVSFVASWIVEAPQRDALRADEDHFLASLRCD
jgi:hypothetical protein